jgi:hypothetical protein
MVFTLMTLETISSVILSPKRLSKRNFFQWICSQIFFFGEHWIIPPSLVEIRLKPWCL